MIFKILFAFLTIAGMFYFLVTKRHSSLPRLFLLVFFGTVLFFILKPEVTNRMAVWVGIGRGADLILYVSTLFLFFICFNFYIRFRETEERLAAVVRDLALERPVKLAETRRNEDDSPP